MSYNITKVTEIDVFVPLAFPNPEGDGLPEGRPTDGRFDWSGPWSGSAYLDGTLARFAETCVGDATFLLTWEDGDSHTVIRLVDGRVDEHEASFRRGRFVQTLSLDGV